MRAGRLDRLVTVQRKTFTETASGEPVEVWSTLANRIPASIWTPPAGEESFKNPQMVAREKVEWLVRYSSALSNLSPLDRIVYPALSEASPEDDPVGRSVYEVTGVHEVGRREGLRIVTARRPDV